MSTLRIPRQMFEALRADLARPHQTALERVGFLMTRPATLAGGPCALAVEYLPVQDDEYLERPLVGACISGAAIRSALQRALDLRAGVLHVHAHEFRGSRAALSGTDDHELARLLPSFAALVPRRLHGSLLLAPGDCVSWFWDPQDRRLVPGKGVSIVGFPIEHYPEAA